MISNPILLSASGQELSTDGDGDATSFATIKVVGPNQSTAIFSRSPNIHLHHLRIDGKRNALGRIQGGQALIEVGGDVKSVHVDHVIASDPRGWSTLHVFEGSRLCSGAKITDNLIGPAGSADGLWADGISFACRNGRIANNVVVDVTDGGIVVFGSPGTVVENNVIETRKAELLGGINLVDFAPFDGDYRGVVIRKNRVIARTGFIKIGIAAGPAAWGIGSNSTINFGARIEQNTIVGPNLGYGIVADGVRDFEVTGNRVMTPLIGGTEERCDAAHVNAGTAFAYDTEHSTGIFQREFKNGHARWSICVTKRNVE
jgi:parallel beta-helix repeat protein